MTTIKPRIGKCKDCPVNAPEQPIIAGRCVSKHYWPYRASLKEKKEPKPRKPIKKVSSKREKVNAVYKVLREQFMKDNPECEGNLPGCSGKATECHHKGGRGANMLDTTQWAALCGFCHFTITVNSALGIEKGLSNRRNTAI